MEILQTSRGGREPVWSVEPKGGRRETWGRTRPDFLESQSLQGHFVRIGADQHATGLPGDRAPHTVVMVDDEEAVLRTPRRMFGEVHFDASRPGAHQAHEARAPRGEVLRSVNGNADPRFLGSRENRLQLVDAAGTVERQLLAVRVEDKDFPCGVREELIDAFLVCSVGGKRRSRRCHHVA